MLLTRRRFYAKGTEGIQKSGVSSSGVIVSSR